MPFMEKQVRRLERTKFTDANVLAQELWAMFMSADSFDFTSPVNFYGGPNAVPPVTVINQPDDTGAPAVPPISYVTSGPTVNVPPFAGVPIPGLSPWQGLPGWTLDSNGLPRPLPQIPGVPPLPQLNPPPIPGVPPPPGVPPVGQTVPPAGTSPPPGTTGGGGLMALVLGKVGGQVYSCRVYSTSIASPLTVNATAIGVDADSDAIDGVYCAAFKLGAAYYITPAVFGEYPA